MAQSVSLKKEIRATVDAAILRVTSSLKEKGFGVLTRIDFHDKIKEKTGKSLSPVVILGACNPALALEAYQQNTDVAALLPCNAVIREVSPGRVSVELAKPSSMMKILGDEKLVNLASDADSRLEEVLEKL